MLESLLSYKCLMFIEKLTYWWNNMVKLDEEITNTTKGSSDELLCMCIEGKWIENEIITVLMFMSVRLK